MKTKFLLFACFISLVNICCYAFSNKIRGNGNVITRNISINDYDKISITGPFTIEYKQSQEPSALKLTTDENLFEYIDIHVVNSELQIQIKCPPKCKNGISIEPKELKIVSHSKNLNKISLTGSGSFLTKDLVSTKNMIISLTGSGDICLQKLEANILSCNLAGSGDISIQGKCDVAKANIAGSGDIDLQKCEANQANCDIAGSGDIKIYATKKINANIVGSGSIHYTGNPEIQKSIIGNGSVTRIN